MSIESMFFPKIVFSIGIILVALYWLYKDWLFQKNKMQTVGKIISIEHKVIGRNEEAHTDIWGYEFSVAFSTDNINPAIVTYTSSDTNFYYVGMEVNVSYDRGDPQRFIINGEYGNKAYNYVAPLILLIIGIVLLIIILI